MSTGLVETRFDPDAPIAWVRLMNAGRANSLTPEIAGDLADAIDDVQADVSVVVLWTEGATFCAGVDLSFARDVVAVSDTAGIRDSVYAGFQRMIRAIHASEVPVIARAQGAALGAGADLFLACDLRIGTPNTWIEESWIKLGATSALGGADALAHCVGPSEALEMLLVPSRRDCEWLRASGLLQRVVPPEELDEEVTRIASQVALQDRQAILAAKALVFTSEVQARRERALQQALEWQVRLLTAPGFMARVEALQLQLDSRQRENGGR